MIIQCLSQNTAISLDLLLLLSLFERSERRKRRESPDPPVSHTQKTFQNAQNTIEAEGRHSPTFVFISREFSRLK
jgi:hypothetical protein